MSAIRLENLSRVFGEIHAVDNISHVFEDGDVTCLLGPSGCGKTTLLRLIAGLERSSHGRIIIGDIDVTDSNPERRQVGMVFQYPVVYRGISVKKNIELPLLHTKLSKAERLRNIEDAVEVLELKEVLHEDVDYVDGVTRQKVAVAREVARRPRILLFDEPLTNLDARSKLRFKSAFKTLTEQLSQTIVYVTHDQTEAMTLADKIALMESGRIVQCDTPRNLYENPVDTFAGWFLGNPGMNFFPTLSENPENQRAISELLSSDVVQLQGKRNARGLLAGIRPEDIEVSTAQNGGYIRAAVLHDSITVGGQHLLTLSVGSIRLKVKVRSGADFGGSSMTWIRLPRARIRFFDESTRKLLSSDNPAGEIEGVAGGNG